MWGSREVVGYYAVCPILAGTWWLIWLIGIPLLAWSGLPSLLQFFVNCCPLLCNTIAILNGFYCTNSPEASSVSPLWLYSCAKKITQVFQLSLVGFSLGNLYVEPAVAKPGSKTKCSRYLPSAVDRSDKNMAFITPLHLFKLLISSEPRSCKKKISIITWSCSLGLGIVGKDMNSCILKWCSDFQSIFVHESGARCPHFAKSSISGFCGVPSWSYRYRSEASNFRLRFVDTW